MSDRLFQRLITATPAAEIDGETLAHEVAATITALSRAAEDRPLPVALDWSGLAIEVGPVGPHLPEQSGQLLVSASAPVK